MNLENMTWSEIVMKLEEKFKKQFGFNLTGSVQTYGGTLIFTASRLKIRVNDSYGEGEDEYCIGSYLSLDSLNSSIVDDLEKLFLIGLKNEEIKNKHHKQNLEKIKAFLEKGF